nr:hypothetical protein [Tanacetum cinerariifolium]
MANDDPLLTTMRFIPQHEVIQKYDAILPDYLTTQTMKESEAYKTYHNLAIGKVQPKAKYVRRSSRSKTKQAPKLFLGKSVKAMAKVATSREKKQPALGLETLTEKFSDEEDDDVANIGKDEDDDNTDHDDDSEQTDSDNDGDDFVHPKFSTHNDKARQEEEVNEEENVPVTTPAEPPLLSATTLHPLSTPIIPHLQQTLVPSPVNVQSSSLQDLPNFGSLFGFDHRLKTLEVNFSEFMQTNYFGKAISLILSIIDKYIDNWTNEAMKKIIKEQVKEQVKAQVSKILQKIEKTVNEQLEAKVLTRLSNSSKTSHAVATNLFELELKKILIDKMESNKSIHRSDEQKNLYKALVDAYECNKLILDTYGDTITLKRRQDDEDKDEEPSAGSNRGSKRRRAGKEQESTSTPKEKTSKTTGKSTKGSKSHHKSASESTQAEELMYTTKDLEGPAHQEFDTGATEDQPVEEAPQHSDWFQT